MKQKSPSRCPRELIRTAVKGLRLFASASGSQKTLRFPPEGRTRKGSVGNNDGSGARGVQVVVIAPDAGSVEGETVASAGRNRFAGIESGIIGVDGMGIGSRLMRGA